MFQSWVVPLNVNGNAQGPGAALASSTSLTDITPGAASTSALILPANSLAVGSHLRVKAGGSFSTTGTPTLLIGVYYGAVAGTKLAAIAATATPSGAANLPWMLEYDLFVRAIGTSGSIIGQGRVDLGSTLALFTPIPLDAAAIAAVAIDTTANKALTIGAQWGTNNAANTITCHYFSVESVH